MAAGDPWHGGGQGNAAAGDTNDTESSGRKLVYREHGSAEKAGAHSRSARQWIIGQCSEAVQVT